MAQRRMFSPDIICSEEFLTMPVSSRDLYVQLAIRADDDGFIQPRLVMRTIGADDNDLDVLLGKRFILTFENGVIVIKHWLIHNTIKADRYKPTRFQEQKEMLQIKENKAYTDSWNQNGTEMEPQVRLGKVKLEKLSYDSVPSKTLKEYTSLRRKQAGKEPHVPRPASEKQKASLSRLAALDYFHNKGVEQDFEYLLEEDEQANRRFIGMARSFMKRYPNNWKEVIDWWFQEDHAWCDYQPSNFFSVATWMKFDNRSNSKKERREVFRA